MRLLSFSIYLSHEGRVEQSVPLTLLFDAVQCRTPSNSEPGMMPLLPALACPSFVLAPASSLAGYNSLLPLCKELMCAALQCLFDKQWQADGPFKKGAPRAALLKLSTYLLEWLRREGEMVDLSKGADTRSSASLHCSLLLLLNSSLEIFDKSGMSRVEPPLLPFIGWASNSSPCLVPSYFPSWALCS
jgi:hypothetical protein